MYSIRNALIARITCHVNSHCWPLLLDQGKTAEMWIHALQEADNFIHPEDLNRGRNKSVNDYQINCSLPVFAHI